MHSEQYLILIVASWRTQLPGVVAFVGADDIPSAGQNKVFDDVLFAADRVNYVGQRLGLIVATSQVGRAGSACTCARMCPLGSTGRGFG